MADIMAELMKDTKFESMADSKILTSRMKVLTPLESLNCLLGGGIPLGGVFHMFGEPKSSKSTFFYQMMGLFQKQYINGISVILDMESSADPERLKAMGCDVSRIVRLPATSIENGFKSLMKLLKNKEGSKSLKGVPIFVIWDTISNGQATDSTIQSRMAAMDRARVIKGYMAELQKSIEKHDFFLGLLNQIIWETDSYGNRKAKAGGGVALTHANQLSIFSKLGKDKFNDQGMLTNRYIKYTIDKSKISPEVKNINVNLDVAAGGLINYKSSFVSYCEYLGLIDTGSAGWFQMIKFTKNKYTDDLTRAIVSKMKLPFPKDKNVRRNDYFGEFRNNDLLFKLLTHSYMRMVESIYSLQREVMKDYHMERLEEIKQLCIEQELLTSEEFDSYIQTSTIVAFDNDQEEEKDVEGSNPNEETVVETVEETVEEK